MPDFSDLLSQAKLMQEKMKETQEMLKNNFLCGNLFYPSTSHTKKDIKDFFNSLDKVLRKLKLILDKNEKVKDHLKGPVSHNSFERLN